MLLVPFPWSGQYCCYLEILGFLRPYCVLGRAAFIFALSAASYLLTTRPVPKSPCPSSIGLRGNERIIDIGCGRGAVLLMLPALLRAKAVGIDLWNSVDQSGTLSTLPCTPCSLEGVVIGFSCTCRDNCPFPDRSFGRLASQAWRFTIFSVSERSQAITEVRVLKPARKTCYFVDFHADTKLQGAFEAAGYGKMPAALGWRFWQRGPWAASKWKSA